jgi:hypothetical protein
MKRLLLLLGVWLGIVSACKNPIDGLEIRFKKPYPVALDVQYYTAAGDSVPATTQIILAGPDANRLITTVNTKKIKVSSDGALFMSVDSLGPRPTPENPLRYTVVVKSPGFVDAILPVEMKSEAQRSVVLIMQPSGANSKVRVAQTNIGGQGTMDKDWSVETPTPILSGQSTAQALLTKGAQLKDVKGAAVGGTLRNLPHQPHYQSDHCQTVIAGRNGGGGQSAVDPNSGGFSASGSQRAIPTGQDTFATDSGAFQRFAAVVQPTGASGSAGGRCYTAV